MDLDPEGQPSTDQMGPATAMGQGNPSVPSHHTDKVVRGMDQRRT